LAAVAVRERTGPTLVKVVQVRFQIVDSQVLQVAVQLAAVVVRRLQAVQPHLELILRLHRVLFSKVEVPEETQVHVAVLAAVDISEVVEVRLDPTHTAAVVAAHPITRIRTLLSMQLHPQIVPMASQHPDKLFPVIFRVSQGVHS
jgi:hypothetical protein